MERKLFQVFDRQRFQQNARLAGIISDVESRYARVQADDDLEIVSAAGTAESIKEPCCSPPVCRRRGKDNRMIYTQHSERKDYHD